MKHKYILENYDRILKEIKNPHIIFSNDLLPFLQKKSLESLLIYQVEFSIVDHRIKYITKKPVHNLHPNCSKINFKSTGVNPAFDIYIPIVLKEWNLSNSNLNWHWCSKKDNTLYILESCEIDDLTQENRFFLYCYQTLKHENYEIKKVNKERIYNLNSKVKIEQYIHQKQYALENLSQNLIKEFSPRDFRSLNQFTDNYNKTDCLKITYIYLEKLHRFIEKEYKNYLNIDSHIPYRSIFFKEHEINKKIKTIKLAFVNSDINNQLLNILYEPLLKIATLNIKEKLTYYDFNYCTEFISEINKLIQNNKIGQEAIIDCLIFLNFNSIQFIKFITDNILLTLENSENNIQKIDNLYLLLKCYNQKQVRNITKYKVTLPSVNEQIINWIEEEIAYYKRSLNLETNQFKTISEHETNTKFLSVLSVAQLSCFFGLLLETEIIKHKNQTDVLKFIAKNFKTNNTENISVDSLKVKYYNVESGTKKAIKEKIIELLALAKN